MALTWWTLKITGVYVHGWGCVMQTQYQEQYSVSRFLVKMDISPPVFSKHQAKWLPSWHHLCISQRVRYLTGHQPRMTMLADNMDKNHSELIQIYEHLILLLTTYIYSYRYIIWLGSQWFVVLNLQIYQQSKKNRPNKIQKGTRS